ncbi:MULTISPECIES: NAD(P)/FAD-dependent oxidoreductase [Hydrocarboniphaga]|jgi:3-phenylpropionate/trans-cinnamate dioxygenase ferredoxin reductase subunit|uniref:NAD(P)/FAD-dependent oxidoreductase n=1 Tax=Hydrocarboniphaga TaxID=243627 RepID=UPI00058BEEC1|nr:MULTISPECIES: FAD-dependent oxidoreductase [Hydrocarboniphaga]MDZ4078885.1 FAD-dependent oxidoreductase [Hydrocarboniphaga sp.]
MTTEETSQPVLIVGAGHAAGEMATALRMNGYKGPITLIGEEPHLPYQRPPLSKAFLSGDITHERLYVKGPAVYTNAAIDFIPNSRVTAIDKAAKTVTLEDGRTLSYSKLVLATGGRPRQLSLGDERVNKAPNLHYLRTIGHVDNMREQFKPGNKLVIIGGGYIGLEVAAVARKKGIDVTVLEAMDRVLQRVTAPEVSAFYQQVHGEAGVNILVNTALTGFEFDAEGKVTTVLTANGHKIPADVIIVGIGLIPNVELAEQAGLALENGIAVDEYGQTSDPDILAIGDCSSHPNAYAGRRLRLESVPSALEQARSAAALLVGQKKPYNAVPWFWSDQYDLKLQMVGLNQGYDTVALRGSPANRNFLAFYLKDGVVLAVDSISRPQEFMVAKKLVAERVKADPMVLVDESQPLKALVPAAPAPAAS